jgi:serine/threonine protein phosphatase PrpC
MVGCHRIERGSPVRCAACQVCTCARALVESESAGASPLAVKWCLTNLHESRQKSLRCAVIGDSKAIYCRQNAAGTKPAFPRIF